jgi:hypothetical protein
MVMKGIEAEIGGYEHRDYPRLTNGIAQHVRLDIVLVLLHQLVRPTDIHPQIPPVPDRRGGDRRPVLHGEAMSRALPRLHKLPLLKAPGGGERVGAAQLLLEEGDEGLVLGGQVLVPVGKHRGGLDGREQAAGVLVAPYSFLPLPRALPLRHGARGLEEEEVRHQGEAGVGAGVPRHGRQRRARLNGLDAAVGDGGYRPCLSDRILCRLEDAGLVEMGWLEVDAVVADVASVDPV